MDTRKVKTKSNDDSLTKAIIFILLITMIAMIFVSNTYAKYTSSATGTDTATVAKWSFDVNSSDIATTETFTFNLFETINDTDGTAEDNVSAGLIAPGTQGSFALDLKNNSQVNAQYEIDYTVTNDNNIPIQYSVDGGSTWTTSLSDVAASTDTVLNVGSDTKTVNVQWKWVFDGDDSADTTLGELARTSTTAPSITVEAKVTASQYTTN